MGIKREHIVKKKMREARQLVKNDMLGGVTKSRHRKVKKHKKTER
jgi:hypothetical protein